MPRTARASAGGFCDHVLNHFHLVLWPHKDGDLSRWMQWLLTAHVRRYHRHYGGSGHVWQGRFKAFPIQQDEHLLSVLRYVERDALRVGLVRRAEDWPWGSLAEWGRPAPDSFLHPGPVPHGR
ncbi:MAG TPA: transposase, partial [Planctomycetaceae bacterium]|nr:transposase [Planctomycetaceae bacterium]